MDLKRSIETISPRTNMDLWQVLSEYNVAVPVPQYMRVGRFAIEYAAYAAPAEPSTRIITNDTCDSLGVDFVDRRNNIMFMLDIDLYPEAPAKIVWPGFFLPDGSHCYCDDLDGQFMRKPLRYLSEKEGQALIADMHQIVAEASSV